MRPRPEGYVKAVVYRSLWALFGAGLVAITIVRTFADNGYHISYPLVALFLVLLAIPPVIVRWVEHKPVPATLLEDPHTDRSFPDADDAVRVAVSRWDLRLELQSDDVRRARALAELTGDRLRLVHGVDLATEPERVVRLVGPHLWAMLSNPPAPMGPHELARVITEMEAL